MPKKRGPGTHRGFMTPPTGFQSPCIRETVRMVYGGCRSKHPGEDPAEKAFCARIAWSTAKRKCR
jgi:hypothetical protein